MKVSSINKEPDSKTVYIWNMLGSMSNALLSVVAFMILTRGVEGREADIFSLAWAVSQLMAIIGTFQIRMFQATDVEEKFTFDQYLQFRIVTIVVMMIGCGGYVLLKHYEPYKALVVIVITLFRGIDCIADVYEGWFQQKERLDLASKAIVGRVWSALLVFAAGLFLTRNLMIASLSLTAAYAVCFYAFDYRYTILVDCFRQRKREKTGKKWMLQMAVEGFPLFVNAFLMMSIVNAPKLAIDVASSMGRLKDGVQTEFTVLFMPASFLTLAYIFFRPLVTHMAVFWSTNRKRKMLKILGRLVGALLAISVVILAGSALLGIPILSVVYSLELSPYRTELLILIAGGCIYTFANAFDNVLVVIRKQYLLIIAYVITWIYSKIVTQNLVFRMGMKGAALSYASTMLLFFLVTTLLFGFGLFQEKQKKNRGKAEEK